MLRKKHMLLAVLLSMVMILLTACGDTKEYSFGTGNMGGNYYAYGNALAGLLKQEDEALTVNVTSTAGSAANLRLLQKGFLDMAIVQSDTLMDAYQGTGVFEGNTCTGVRAIAGLYMEECQIIVRADSDIYSVADLYKRNVSVGEQESGVMQNAKQILLANGISMEMIQASYMSFSDSAASLKSGEIDAFFCTAGAPTTAVQELSKEMEIRLISLDERNRQQLIKEYPCYTECVIPAGTYIGQEEDVTTIGVKAVLVVSNKMSDEMAGKITDTLFGHVQDLQYATSVSSLDTDFAVQSVTAPFHSGAAAWYAGKNIEVSTTDSGNTSYGVTAGQD